MVIYIWFDLNVSCKQKYILHIFWFCKRIKMSGYGSKRRSKLPARSYSSEDDDDSNLLSFLLELQKKSLGKKRKTSSTKAKPKKRTKKQTKPNPNPNEIVKVQSDEEHEDDNKSHFENIQSNKIDNFFKSRMLISDSEEELNLDSNTDIKFVARELPKEKRFYTLESDSDEDYLKHSEIKDTTISIDNSKPSTSTANDSVIEIDEKTETVEEILADIDLIAPKNKITVLEKDKEESWNNMLKETEEILESVSKLVGIEKKETEEQNKSDSPSKSTPSCPICLESLSNQEVSATICGHLFCKPCINAVLKSTNKRCPTCRKALNAKKIHPLYL
ncbi:unnamed protein product [Brassicogethes aeneus]|uniref:RING-type domain-containing protein n=1 Tax=Brassicogethes aeneus TaxID=1431903 RepID=A0A9P0B6P0_BRAAE|nr:unnamed protein product [Brassicogethes aeneus]